MSESETHLEPAPGKTAFDYGMAIVKVGALAFPFLGPGITLFDLVTAPARGKRLSDWCEELRLRLNDLSEKVSGLTPEVLATNEVFISAFAQATTAAIKTHQKEKLEALRNAVLNIATGHSPDEDEQTMFLRYIEEFTPWHILILKFLDNPSAFIPAEARTNPRFQARSGSRAEFLCRAYPALSNRQDFYDPIVHELRGRSLITGDVPNLLHGATDGNGVMSGSATKMGQRFLKFIDEPNP